jgi:uncharacterized membrane protein
MLPDPLHPAVVHLPIALAVVVPLMAVLALLAIGRGLLPARAWIFVVVLQALLVGSAWVAHDTGHDQEERVEKVVEERFIHEHEEAADWLLWLSVIAFAIGAAGLLPGRQGVIGRVLGLVASLVVLGAAVQTGRLGGALVYEHGAADAYLEQAGEAGAQ